MSNSIKFTHRQLRIIEDALDLYVRIGLGQFERVTDVFETKDVDVLYALERELKDAKIVAGFHPNGSHGIHHPNVSSHFRSAQDMKNVLTRARSNVTSLSSADTLGPEPEITVEPVV